MSAKTVWKRSSISLKQKYDIIKEFDRNGGDRKAIIRDFGLKTHSHLHHLLKSRDIIVTKYESLDPLVAQSVAKISRSRYPDVEEALMAWMRHLNVEDIHDLPALQIKQKAKQIADTMGYHEFKASDKYLRGLNRRQYIMTTNDSQRQHSVTTNKTQRQHLMSTNKTKKQHSVTTNKTRKPVGSNSVMISIDDVLDELMVENKRLLNELLFANNCLNELKTHLINIHSKYETTIGCEDKQEFNKLTQSLDQINDKLVGNDFQNDLNVRISGKRNGHKVIQRVRQPPNQLLDQTYSDFNDKDIKSEVIDEESDSSYGQQNPKKNYKTLLSNKRLNESNISTKKWATRPKIFKCDYNGCQLAFAFKCVLLRHQRSRHLMDVDMTSEANQKRAIRLAKRLRNFDPIVNAYRCPQTDCHKLFVTSKGLFTHNRDVHTSRKYMCDRADCGKAFKTKSRQKQHSLTHTDNKDFECDHPGCNYRSYFRSNIKKHMVSHMSDRPVPCEYPDCDQTFKTQTALKSHLNRYHNLGPTYVCDYPGCDEQFKNRPKLAAHRAQHTGQYSVGCRQCGQRFPSSHEVLKHRVAAHGKRPKQRTIPRSDYTCEWPGCDYQGTLSRLRFHRMVHTGDKPYQCDWPNCGQRFRLNSVLRDHKYVHNNLKPYACHWPGCQYRCNNSGNICKHYSQMHEKHS